jgi:hypothetical protein
MDPFRSFAHYPTATLQPRTYVSLRPGADAATYAELAGHALFSYAGKVLPTQPFVGALLALLTPGELTIQDLAGRAGLDVGAAVLGISVLAKMGLLRLRGPDIAGSA